jgi:hypothetical protein
MKSSLEITKLYFDLSNQADLAAIEPLFQADATYSSVNTGLYYGIDSIFPMMQAFFSAHQKLTWHAHSIEPLNDYITELHFSCEAINNAGETKNFSGVERVVVVDGLIRHVEVR